eukprot:g45852.t1
MRVGPQRAPPQRKPSGALGNTYILKQHSVTPPERWATPTPILKQHRVALCSLWQHLLKQHSHSVTPPERWATPTPILKQHRVALRSLWQHLLKQHSVSPPERWATPTQTAQRNPSGALGNTYTYTQTAPRSPPVTPGALGNTYTYTQTAPPQRNPPERWATAILKQHSVSPPDFATPIFKQHSVTPPERYSNSTA